MSNTEGGRIVQSMPFSDYEPITEKNDPGLNREECALINLYRVLDDDVQELVRNAVWALFVEERHIRTEYR